MRNRVRQSRTLGSVRGESLGATTVNLNAHEAGNGGQSQGTPTAHRVLLYSEPDRRWQTPPFRAIKSTTYEHSRIPDGTSG
jgi:hypothetical protein